MFLCDYLGKSLTLVSQLTAKVLTGKCVYHAIFSEVSILWWITGILVLITVQYEYSYSKSLNPTVGHQKNEAHRKADLLTLTPVRSNKVSNSTKP